MSTEDLVTRYTALIDAAVMSLFEDGEDEALLDISAVDGNAFFTAYLLALAITLNRFTQEERTLVDVVNTVNSLAFSYLLTAETPDTAREGD